MGLGFPGEQTGKKSSEEVISLSKWLIYSPTWEVYNYIDCCLADLCFMCFNQGARPTEACYLSSK